MEETKLWKVEMQKLIEIKRDKLELEQMLHEWIQEDISIIDEDLIFIGSKVVTDHNKEIDILAIDSYGDLVIIELKRDKTPRDVVAQALDYAAFCATLDENDINQILQKNKRSETIDELFDQNNFSYEDVEINSNQKILIVGTSIDASTERIVRYLSSKAININVTTFSYYKYNSSAYLTRNVLLKDEEIVKDTKTKQKRDKSFFKKLFDEEKLKIGMKLYFKPAVDALNTKEDKKVQATIVKIGTNCLKYYDDNIYSFSGLRKKIATELNLTDVNAGWGFGSRYDWYTETDVSLSEI
ncbi:MAG: hypothetical protein WAR79_15140 [Melioribacteraceae bacterium]